MSLHKLRRVSSTLNFISITKTDDDLDAGASSSTTFIASIGAAPSFGERRFIVITAGTSNNSAGTNFSGDVSEVTFGGANSDAILTYTNAPSGNEAGVIIAIKEISSGTTVSVTVNPDASVLGIATGVYRVITGRNGYATRDTATSTDTSSPILSVSPSAQTDDVAVSVISNVNGFGYSWPAGWTKDFEYDIQSSEGVASAHETFTGTTSSVQISQSNNGDTAASAIAILYPA